MGNDFGEYNLKICQFENLKIGFDVLMDNVLIGLTL